MIRTDTEYGRQQTTLKEQEAFMAAQEKALREEGIAGEHLRRAMAPIRTFHEGLREEVEAYRLLRDEQDLEAVRLFDTLGKQLIALRIMRGVTQRELAKRLGVHESQVSRDEKHEYHRISDERAMALLLALRVKMERTYSLVIDEPALKEA